jgi:predicted oxidoreductase
MTSLVAADRRAIGRFTVGPIGFGCWRMTADQVPSARDALETALDLGMVLVDTADVYGLDWGGAGMGGSERVLGQVLAEAPGLRDRMVLATKGGIAPPVPYDSSDAYLTRACEASLDRLGVGHIDLYQIHRHDHFTHPADLGATLTRLRAEGKILEVGVSNYTSSQADALQAHLPFPLVTDQPEYSLLHLDPVRDGVFDRCMRVGVIPLAWSPLAGGALATGDGVPAELLAAIDELAEREQVSRATIAVAFVLAHPSRPVALVGTQQPRRLRELAAATRVELTRSDVYRLIQAGDGQPLP